MPSFAKPANKSSADSLLESVWKDNAGSELVDDLLLESRARAATILRETIPAKIAHLCELLKGQDDPASPLWKGHVERGAYVMPTMEHVGAAREGFKIEGEAGEQEGAGDAAAGAGAGAVPGASTGSAARVYLPEDIGAVMRRSPLSNVIDGGADDSDDGSDAESGGLDPADNDDATAAGNGLAQKKGAKTAGVRMGQHWFEVVHENTVQRDLIKLALGEFEQMYDIVVELKLWLEMEIPVVEDGNSFGAEVQQHLINKLEDALKRSIAWQNGTRQHFSDRYKMAEIWVKYPNVHDIPAAMASSDRFDHYLVRSYLRNLLIVYAGLMTKFQRNWSKVTTPKGKDGGSVGGMY